MPPPPGALKFNVDASSQGSAGLAGIGGILRDDKGTVLGKFSKCIGRSDPTRAELMAIWEAGIFLSKSKWGDGRSITIESDSQLACKWVGGFVQVPTVFEDIVSKCRRALDKLGIHLVFVYREQNSAAHTLARSGVGRDQALVWEVG
ncbi:hypothetical protein HRI_000115100 [Hibiscus trionum]|uniref:RNase H type-1 domain-containing protein n=1 Tax=Hibiscus trionum TaxID=183268 RepID=A0A9W7LGT9_HIBTR|nr:hypothetical protein HRI_000115100 [Hibiscus trionum]